MDNGNGDLKGQWGARVCRRLHEKALLVIECHNITSEIASAGQGADEVRVSSKTGANAPLVGVASITCGQVRCMCKGANDKMLSRPLVATSTSTYSVAATPNLCYSPTSIMAV